MDVDNTRQRVLSVGATLDCDSEDGLGLLDGDSEIPLLVGHDKCTLRNKKSTRYFSTSRLVSHLKL